MCILEAKFFFFTFVKILDAEQSKHFPSITTVMLFLILNLTYFLL